MATGRDRWPRQRLGQLPSFSSFLFAIKESYKDDSGRAASAGGTAQGRFTGAEEFRGAKRDRTPDLLHAMQALSQLSYGPTLRFGPAPFSAGCPREGSPAAVIDGGFSPARSSRSSPPPAFRVTGELRIARPKLGDQQIRFRRRRRLHR